jgi:uncharacterized protein YjbI with pentapeptide repeats
LHAGDVSSRERRLDMDHKKLQDILAAHKEWRESGGTKGARADLADANLARADLADANLARADLADADLARANLARANFADANLARANLADADLADANLARANLARANLEGAYLARAYLADANLADAYLARANLEGAYLARANLADADLADADLARANLEGAYLAGADLARANLEGAYLAGADLADADLAGAIRTEDPKEPYDRNKPIDYEARALRYRERHPEVPVIPHLDAVILGAIETGGTLDMATWHLCATTHCRAGWAITLAGEAGRKMEEKYGPERAGGMIYKASTGRIPHFFATNERALEDIRKCAGVATCPGERGGT